MNRRNVGILIFDDVEVLDFAGPYEVFSRTRLEPGVESRRSDETAPFKVFTVSGSGDRLQATGGLLAGKQATTHWAALDMLREVGPDVEVLEGRRFVEDTVVSSAGVAAGIDMAFHIVETLCGAEVADETARYIDYPRGR